MLGPQGKGRAENLLVWAVAPSAAFLRASHIKPWASREAAQGKEHPVVGAAVHEQSQWAQLRESASELPATHGLNADGGPRDRVPTRLEGLL